MTNGSWGKDTMKLKDFFQINDWKFNKFLSIILAIQFATWGVIGLDLVGLQIPIIRQLIGIIYVTFIPGIIILRILKLHELGRIDTLLYAIGLSIASLMFTGFFMNAAYPFLGISRPISITPLIITISILVLGLCIISYIIDNDYSSPGFIKVGDILSLPVLFLCLIIFLAIFGAHLVNHKYNNILLILLIIVLSLIAVSTALYKFIPKELYPLSIFSIAISLIYAHTLISMYIVGNDVVTEYFYANLVISNSKWDSAIPTSSNAMLSLAMFVPIVSQISNLDLTWTFKIFCPFLLAIGMLGLYKIYQLQTNEKIAFFSCFFFMSVFIFYMIIPAQINQLFAQFFLILLVLLIVSENITKQKRVSMLIIFGISLIVSHYGTTYILMFCLISAWALLHLVETNARKNGRVINLTLLLLFTVFTVTWYMKFSHSSAFNSILHIGNHIVTNIITDFLSPGSTQGMDIIMRPTSSFVSLINKCIHLFTQVLIGVGIISLWFNYTKFKFNREYVYLSYMFFLICIMSILIPYFSSAMYTARIYFLALTFLAPISVIGSIFIFNFINRVHNDFHANDERGIKKAINMMALVFVLLLLFDSGWIAEVTQQYPISFALSQNSIQERGTAKTILSLYTNIIPEKDVIGSKWLSNNIHDKGRIYATYTDLRVHSLESYGGFNRYRVWSLNNETQKTSGSYIFLQSLNVVYGLGTNYDMIKLSRAWESYNISENNSLMKNMKKIYSNGGVEIYYEDFE